MFRIPLLAAGLVLVTACASSTGSSDKKKDGLRRQVAGLGQMVVPGAFVIFGCDTNQDNQITQAELNTGLLKAFAKADVDGTGVLTIFEYRDWSRASQGSDTALPDWMVVDRNSDRSITISEFQDAFSRIAVRLGLSDENPLSVNDLVMDFQPTIQNRSSPQGGPANGGGKGQRGGRRAQS